MCLARSGIQSSSLFVPSHESFRVRQEEAEAEAAFQLGLQMSMCVYGDSLSREMLLSAAQ